MHVTRGQHRAVTILTVIDGAHIGLVLVLRYAVACDGNITWRKHYLDVGKMYLFIYLSQNFDMSEMDNLYSWCGSRNAIKVGHYHRTY